MHTQNGETILKHFTIHETRRYSVYARSAQDALQAVRSFPHETGLEADVQLDTTSLLAEMHDAVDSAINAVAAPLQ